MKDRPICVVCGSADGAHGACRAYRYQTKKLEQATALLRELVEHEDGPCGLDHHGYCQEHGLDPDPCVTKRARALLWLPDAGYTEWSHPGPYTPG